MLSRLLRELCRGPTSFAMPGVGTFAKGYQRVKLLGQGASGEVWKVLDHDAAQYYALKQMDLAKMSDQQRGFAVQEAQLLHKLEHPHIAKFVDLVLQGTTVCIVMQYFDGGDLQRVIRNARDNRTRLGEIEVWRWCLQLASALQYLHEANVLHRDVKPANIFMSKSAQNAVLGDLGIAKVLPSTGAQTATQIGTPAYLAPEVWQGRRYGPAADVYSLGCTTFELLELRPPFIAMDRALMAAQCCHGRSAPISTRYSLAFRELVQLMISKEARNRPSAVQVLMYAKQVAYGKERDHMATPADEPIGKSCSVSAPGAQQCACKPKSTRAGPNDPAHKPKHNRCPWVPCGCTSKSAVNRSSAPSASPFSPRARGKPKDEQDSARKPHIHVPPPLPARCVRLPPPPCHRPVRSQQQAHVQMDSANEGNEAESAPQTTREPKDAGHKKHIQQKLSWPAHPKCSASPPPPVGLPAPLSGKSPLTLDRCPCREERELVRPEPSSFPKPAEPSLPQSTSQPSPPELEQDSIAVARKAPEQAECDHRENWGKIVPWADRVCLSWFQQDPVSIPEDSETTRGSNVVDRSCAAQVAVYVDDRPPQHSIQQPGESCQSDRKSSSVGSSSLAYSWTGGVLDTAGIILPPQPPELGDATAGEIRSANKQESNPSLEPLCSTASLLHDVLRCLPDSTNNDACNSSIPSDHDEAGH